MPRRGENIYKRKDGRWEGRYIRGRTPAGKAEYGYVYAKSYAACREKRRRMEDALPQKPMLTGEMSVCQAAEFFLSERRGALKASTIGRYEYMIRHYIVPEIGTILLRDLTAEKLSVFFSRLQDRGLSCKSTRDVGVLLKTIFKVVKKKCHCDCPGRDVELPAYGFLSGFLYGWIMNLYFIIGYVSPLTWQTIGAAYLSSFFFDFCHGLCTFLVLWALGDPWVRKLERIKIKFGLTAEERNYVLPPSTFEIARENYE